MPKLPTGDGSLSREYDPTTDTYSLAWKAECEDYLTGQGTYQNRARRYKAVARKLWDLGFEEGDLLYDVGAGMCDFAHFMYRQMIHFRYVPIDGSIDGTDIEIWAQEYVGGLSMDWFVSIETLEHLYEPEAVLSYAEEMARKGIVITTPNPERTDVLALDPTHKTAIHKPALEAMGFTVERMMIHYEEDTLLAWKSYQGC